VVILMTIAPVSILGSIYSSLKLYSPKAKIMALFDGNLPKTVYVELLKTSYTIKI